jgi:hypothetical protein
MDHLEIFDVVGMCNHTKTQIDCGVCGAPMQKNIFKDWSGFMYPSMIGIEPPIDETLDLRTLLKRELHEKYVVLDQNCYCNVCQKTVSAAIQTTYFHDPENYKDDIPKTLIVNVLSCLDANGRCKNPFHVPVEMDFTEFMYESEIDEYKNKINTATLTGFIQRIHCYPGQNVLG